MIQSEAFLIEDKRSEDILIKPNQGEVKEDQSSRITINQSKEEKLHHRQEVNKEEGLTNIDKLITNQERRILSTYQIKP